MGVGLAETISLLREHTTLAEVLRAIEAKGMEAEACLPSNVIVLSEARARRRIAMHPAPL